MENCVPDNETFDRSFDFIDESLFDNNIEKKSTDFDNLPIDFVFTGSEVSKTFIVQNDGTLAELDEQIVVEPVSSNEKVLTRKKKQNPDKWKCNIAKTNRQSGKSYKNRNGVVRRARSVKIEGCANPDECIFKCMNKIDMAGRIEIHNSYWNIEDKEKRHFYAANVKRVTCERKRTEAVVSQKPYNLKYSFNYQQTDISVCQQFFVNTLDINKGRVYYFFRQAEKRKTVTPGPATHGKHVKKKLSEEQKQGVRDHINKFPAVESHYCRQNTSKLYLDQGLNLARMYRMYATETEKPVKESAYRNIFDYEFNLSFFRPKKDRCDKCVESTMILNPSEEKLVEYNLHLARKEKAHAERNKDRDLGKISTELVKIGVIPFDMENVFQMPIANASQLFYLRKFSVYVLTIFFNKTVYNVMWNEFICGREGTHLASALIKGLKQIVLDNPQLEELILWSDSCVPQNRNSYMSAALQDFLKSEFSGNVKQIDHKYSEAGHGEVQEVDNVHSVTENFIRHKFLYSPVSLINEFGKMQSGKLNFKLLQMRDEDYFDYQTLALASKYSVIPYSKVVHLRYKKNDSDISYKLDYSENFIENNILLKRNYAAPPPLKQLDIHSNISNLKIDNLRSMFNIMPEVDKNYYETEIAKLMKKRDVAAVAINEVEVQTASTEAIENNEKAKASAMVKSKTNKKYTSKSGTVATNGMDRGVTDEPANNESNTKAKAPTVVKSKTNKKSTSKSGTVATVGMDGVTDVPTNKPNNTKAKAPTVVKSKTNKKSTSKSGTVATVGMDGVTDVPTNKPNNKKHKASAVVTSKSKGKATSSL